jgi:hypothetical protein
MAMARHLTPVAALAIVAACESPTRPPVEPRAELAVYLDKTCPGPLVLDVLVDGSVIDKQVVASGASMTVNMLPGVPHDVKVHIDGSPLGWGADQVTIAAGTRMNMTLACD